MYRLLNRMTTNHDGPGNMLSQQHLAAVGWTRSYTLFATNNRLRRTTLAGVTQNYNYDTRGNMTGGLPHLTNGSGGVTGTMRYNEENRLDRVIQNANVTIYYQYDSAGQRVRKTLKNSQGTIVETRKYVGGWEVYERKAGGVVDYRRESLHVMDDQERVALSLKNIRRK